MSKKPEVPYSLVFLQLYILHKAKNCIYYNIAPKTQGNYNMHLHPKHQTNYIYTSNSTYTI